MNKLVNILVVTIICYLCAQLRAENQIIDVYEAAERHSVIFKEKEPQSHRMVEIVFGVESNKHIIIDCNLFGDKKLAETEISKRTVKPEVRFVSKKELSDWADICSELLLQGIKKELKELKGERNFPEEYDNPLDRGFFDGLLIYPGTKWCGAGDIAEDYDDLGREVEADKCCREHDYCFDNIYNGQTKYNLTNKAIHTKSHCYCDTEFSSCLKYANTNTATQVAKLYFNLIQVQCFKKEHPIVECLEWKGFPLYWKSCQKYKLDYALPLLYQFFDAKYY